MRIDAKGLDFKGLCEMLKKAHEIDVREDIVIDNCMGQRYIGAGMEGVNISIFGTPGNSLGSCFNGSKITVYGNAQDAAGDTMNDGTMVIHGSAGDAIGYAMRGGKIFVRDNVSYRAGIHMKEYKDRRPALVIGGCAGSFLGEYQAGGVIIVLNLKGEKSIPVGDFCGTGMHGGKIYVRCDQPLDNLPKQVMGEYAGEEDMEEINPLVREFCDEFHLEHGRVMSGRFICLKPDSKNPYRQMYTHN